MDRLIIREYKSPFRYTEPRVIELEPTPYLWQASLADIRRANLPAIVPFVFVVNGTILKENELAGIYLVPSDVVIAVPDPGDDDALPIIVGLLFAVAAIAISGGALGPAGLGLFGNSFIAGGMGAIATSMAVSIMGGIVTSMLTKPPDTPTMDALQGFNTSQTYSWNPQTTQQQGGAIPRPYGCNKLYGNIINWNIENVNETQYLNVLICLGCGPVSRLYNYEINDQPVGNYRGVEIHTRLGYLDQSPIPNFNDTKVEIGPISPMKVVNGTPVLFTTAGDNLNGLEVDVTFSQGLWHANDLGGLDAISVNLSIDIRKQGGGAWIPLAQQVVTSEEKYYAGKWSLGCWMPTEFDTSWYEVAAGDANPLSHYDGELTSILDRTYYWRWIDQQYVRTVSSTVNYVTIAGAQNTPIRRTFRSYGLEPGKYDIQVTNHSADRTSSRDGDDCYLTAVREVYVDDFEYPRMVLVGIRALATDQLSGSLRFSCYCDGALVRSTLDGSVWSTGFSRQPAWVGHDILTRPVLDNDGSVVRYDGLMPDKADIDSHLDLVQYDSTLVPDGKGSTEELCLFDGTFDHASTVWDALLKVYRTGRAVPYYAGTKIGLSINRPEATPEAGFLVGMGSILAGSFQEHWSSVEDRPTELTIEILNGDNDFEREPLQVINPNLTSYQPPLSMDMFGVIRPSQAWRDGRLRLNANQNLTNTVSVSLPALAIECRIGQVVNISHDVPQWGYSGRIVGISGDDTAIVDRELTMSPGVTYGMIIWLKKDVRIYREVLSITSGTVVKFKTAFDAGDELQKYDNYSFGEIGLEAKPFRVLSVQPDMEHRFKLTCLEYNSSLWNSDAEQPVLPTPDYSSLDPVPVVLSLAAQDRMTKRIDGTIDELIHVSFMKPASFVYDHAEIWYSRDGASFVFAGTTRGTSYDIPCIPLSHYDIAVVTVNTAGLKTTIANSPKVSIVPLGKTARPSNVTEFSASPALGGVRFYWTAVPDVDIDYYLLRYNANPDGTWPNSVDVAKIYGTSITLPAAAGGKYLIKAFDTSENESASSISIITDIPTILSWNVQEELIEEPLFAGTKTHMAVSGGKLVLDSQGELGGGIVVGSLDVANLFISLDNSMAFADASAEVLKHYPGYRLIVADSASKKAIGYIHHNPDDPKFVQMTYAASGSSGITVADNDNVDFGTGNFTLVWQGALPDWTPGATRHLLFKREGASPYTGYLLLMDTSGGFRVYIYRNDTGTTYASTVNNNFVNGTVHEITAVITRETASTAGSVVFYADGVQFGNSVAIGAAEPYNLDNAQAFLISGNNSARFESATYRALIYNCALSAAEALSLYQSGIATADKWGSQTNKVVSSWSNGALWYDTFDGASAAGFHVIHDGTPNDVRATTADEISLVTGKKYRVSWTNTVASGEIPKFSIRQTYLAGNYASTDTQQETTVNGANVIEFTSAYTDTFQAWFLSTAATEFTISNFSIVEIGATLALESSGITATDWQDSSTNNLDASYPATGFSVYPAGTGVRIKSLPSGSTYSWESIESGFDDKDAKGYTYIVTDGAGVDDIDAIANFDTLDSDYWPEGFYETPEVDLGSVQTARCTALVEFAGIDSEHLFDDIGNLDAASNIDGDLSAVGVQTQIALSQNGTEWGAWQNFMIGDYTAMKMKMRAWAYTNKPRQYIEISKLHFTIDMPDRSESGQDVLVPETGLNVTFVKPFMAKPMVGVTIQSALDGDRHEVSNITTTGFTVFVKNAGNAVSRTINWEAKKY